MTAPESEGQRQFARRAEDPRGRNLPFGRRGAVEPLRREIGDERRADKGQDDACEAFPRRSSR